MDWLGIAGNTAFVTGGASGIGKAICDGLAEQGVKVCVADVNRDGGEAYVTSLREAGHTAHFVVCNVTERASIDAALAECQQELGTPSYLINNAGINIPRLLIDPAGEQELDEAVWDKVCDINFKGVFLCAQIIGRAMLANGGGVIVNMASESGLEGSEGQSVYAGTKGAVYSLTRSWAKELGKHKIRVVGVAPGIMEATALRSEAYESALAYTRGISVDELRAGYGKVSSIPIGRSGRLSEVADTVCYLCSERASYIHGTTVNLSGGKSRA